MSSPHGIQPDPKRTTRSMTRWLRVPLTQMGTPPACNGFGIWWMWSNSSSSDW